MDDRDPASARQLLGRAAECGEIERLLGSVRGGLSGALVLRGEPGIGKTALLEYAAGLATDMHLLRLVGIESEMELGYAALHQLLLPFLGDIDVLPVRQRGALGAAFGLEGEATVDRMMVGLATLTLLSASAKPQPVLCVIDDAQWIDRESAEVLAFVARRLFADQVGMVIAVRDPFAAGHAAFDGIAEIRLDGLAEAEAGELLAREGGRSDPGSGEPTGHRRDRRQPAGPGGARAAAHGRPAGRGDGCARAVAGWAPAGSALLRPGAQPCGGYPDVLVGGGRRPDRRPGAVGHVGGALGFGRDAAAAAEAADLLVLGPPVAFRHPLIRSAVYYGAPQTERRRVHEALAEATDADRDADRRAWHGAAAAEAGDEEVAADLERAAGGLGPGGAAPRLRRS